MHVARANYAPNPEHIIAAAARSSASQLSIEEPQQKMPSQQIDNLFKIPLYSGHFSPTEQANLATPPTIARKASLLTKLKPNRYNLCHCNEREICGIFPTVHSAKK